MGGTNDVWPGGRGAHILTASAADTQAFAIGKDNGTLFYDYLIEGVSSGEADPQYSGSTSAANVNRPYGGGIIRLGAIKVYISGKLDQMRLEPGLKEKLKSLKLDFSPQPRIGPLQSGTQWSGAFFFLGPPKNSKVLAEMVAAYTPRHNVKCGAAPHDCLNEEPTSQIISLEFSTTGSSVIGHPSVAVFDAPNSYKIAGVDVSQWQGDIDWVKLAGPRTRVKFAYLKATEGATLNDPLFEANWRGSQQGGLLHGAYHVLNFCKTAEEQFENILKTVPKEKDSLPIAVSVLWFGQPYLPSQSNCNDIKRIRAMLLELLFDLERAYEKVPVIYIPAEGVGAILDESFYHYSIWLRYFKPSNDSNFKFDINRLRLPGGNPWAIWQVSEDGEFPGTGPGIRIPVEVYFGNERQFRAFVQSGSNQAFIASATGKAPAAFSGSGK